MSLEGSNNTNLTIGQFAIDIDGISSPIIARRFVTGGAFGAVGVLFRSGTLGIGTHTIKGRYYTKKLESLVRKIDSAIKEK